MTASILSRRTVLGAAAALTTMPAAAQTGPGDEVVELWPGPPPGDTGARISRKVADQSRDPAKPDRWLTGIARPVLIVRRPARPNGAAVLLCPGGGYGFLSYDNEGTSQAAWLNAHGITAFILLYRLPNEGWANRAVVPLQDAQRAMRIIRARAAGFGVAANRVAVLGFSAGGHLAGSLATRHALPTYTSVDAADRLSARPDVAGLVYPVISFTAPFTHGGSRDMLLGAEQTPVQRTDWSIETRVDAATPPILLVHATDDGLVPPENSIALYRAMRTAGRPVAMHIFEDGGHGFGVRLPATQSASVWPSLFATFAARQGVFPA